MEGFNLLNKAFDSRVRLGLMSILSVNDWISYKEVKNLLNLTALKTVSFFLSLNNSIPPSTSLYVSKGDVT